MAVIRNPPDNPEPRWLELYAEGYKAGRISALREVGCVCGGVKGHRSDGKMICGCDISTIKCHRCRLLAEAESEAGEVG